uniref:Proteinase inhibitor I2, Kunitz metazoa,domain-containing protein n=1 Tax=Schistosoma japonicum TaxID=6182 RepID=C1LH87_SCHJA|nr:Proteinase inhibitor I2, Kunitz metazoa,domain-containing protein [Schistosoma japonicum]
MITKIVIVVTLIVIYLNVYYSSPPITREVCGKKVDPGTCRNNYHNYFYNATKHKCLQLLYNGHGGNDNRFETKYECERTCMT